MKLSASLAFLFAGRHSALTVACLLFLSVLLAITTVARADLVQNGDFETGTFSPGWLYSGDSYGYVTTQAAHTGSYSASLSGDTVVGGWDTISQTLNTEPGQDYTVDFYLYRAFAPSLSAFFQFSWNGNPEPLIPSSSYSTQGPNVSWIEFTYTETATSTSTNISFYGHDAPGYTYIDDIHVVPEPATITLLVSALLVLGVVYLRRRSALYSALALSLAVLLAIATNASAVQYTTYTIVDYPQPDALHPEFTDHFTGTISIPAYENNATYTTIPSDLSAIFQITGPGGTFTTPVTTNIGFPYYSGLKFTPTSVIIPPGSSLDLFAPDGAGAQLNFYWYNLIASQFPSYHSLSAGNSDGSPQDGRPQFTLSSIGLPPVGSDMVIASVVPEPATITLLVSAMLGLGVVYLRRKNSFIALLLLSAVLIATASTAKANQITYTLKPFTYEDNINNPDHSKTDTLTGTISVSATGTYTHGDPSNSTISVLANFIMTSSDPSILQVTDTQSSTLDTFLTAGTLTFSPTGIDLNPDATFSFNYHPGVIWPAYVIPNWTPQDGVFTVAANPGGGYNGGGATMQIFNTDLAPNFVDGVWTIATVPEPCTLTLLGSALLGLGVVYLRRRGAKD